MFFVLSKKRESTQTSTNKKKQTVGIKNNSDNRLIQKDIKERIGAHRKKEKNKRIVYFVRQAIEKKNEEDHFAKEI
jgi:hypothetical protein